MSMRIRSCLRDWNLSGPMVSGLAETPQMDVTSHSRVKADEFIGLPQLVTKYQSKQKSDGSTQ
eukprot:1850864-Amphidinium_carterae.1